MDVIQPQEPTCAVSLLPDAKVSSDNGNFDAMDVARLFNIVQQFGTEDRCRDYLEALRWPDGVKCPRCNSDKVFRIIKRNRFDCDGCRYQFSVTAGTIFNNSHLPLKKWFLCVHLLCVSSKGTSANKLKDTLGTSYKTAWYLCHRIRSAIKDVHAAPWNRMAREDDACVCKKADGNGFHCCLCKHEQFVIGIKPQGGELRFFVVEELQSAVLASYVRKSVRNSVELFMLDEMSPYSESRLPVDSDGCRLETIQDTQGNSFNFESPSDGIKSKLSFADQVVSGTWHKVSAKHLPAYIDHIEFRFKNRSNPYLFRDTLIKLIEAPVLKYKNLTQDTVSGIQFKKYR